MILFFQRCCRGILLKLEIVVRDSLYIVAGSTPKDLRYRASAFDGSINKTGMVHIP